MIIYKIVNNINGKVYIGLTTCTLEYRWQKHLVEGRNKNNNKPLYRAMKKYGIENFSIEQIDTADDLKTLGELERKYIKQYDSQNLNKGYNLTAGGERNRWDANPASKFTYEEVIQIREIYNMRELSLRECWQMFKDKMSYSGFQKVWDGTTWHGILDEVYTKDNIELHSHQTGLRGSQHPNARLTEEEVLEARKYYVNHTLQETFNKYGKEYTLRGFRGVLTRCFSHIPIYKKVKKQWILYNEIIDINNYKPVSTISESGE